MGTTMYPKNAGNGYFGNMGKPFMYMPDKYVEQLPYAKTQPYDTRWASGTHDASKRDEFTDRVRTEQYRDLLKKEKSASCAHEQKARRPGGADPQGPQEIGRSHRRKERQERWACPRRPSSTTSAARRNAVDPKTKTDCFYNAYQARKREMRRGGYRSMSQDIGDGAWDLQQARGVRPLPRGGGLLLKSHIEVAGTSSIKWCGAARARKTILGPACRVCLPLSRSAAVFEPCVLLYAVIPASGLSNAKAAQSCDARPAWV